MGNSEYYIPQFYHAIRNFHSFIMQGTTIGAAQKFMRIERSIPDLIKNFSIGIHQSWSIAGTTYLRVLSPKSHGHVAIERSIVQSNHL